MSRDIVAFSLQSNLPDINEVDLDWNEYRIKDPFLVRATGFERQINKNVCLKAFLKFFDIKAYRNGFMQLLKYDITYIA